MPRLFWIQELYFKSPRREGAAVFCKASTCLATVIWGLTILLDPPALARSYYGATLTQWAPAWGWGLLGTGIALGGLYRMLRRSHPSVTGCALYALMLVLWGCLWTVPVVDSEARFPGVVAALSIIALMAGVAAWTSVYWRSE